MKRIRIIPFFMTLLLLSGCAAQTAENTYRQIDSEEAAALMEEKNNYIILDVRTEEEYSEGHIPNAINIPNESIGTEEIPELPDKDQLILVYCRSGNRSKQASRKLADLGYTNIVEFGGIIDWTGETQSDSQSVPQTINSAGAEVSSEEALVIALNNADVPEADAYNIKNERDSDNGIPIHDIEFETDYGDYDFEVSVDGGRIVGADYEVDEEYLNILGGSAVSLEEAKKLIADKVPGSDAENVQIWEENEDGRGRVEGELYFENMKYEFEIDPATGRIFDWNADLRG